MCAMHATFIMTFLDSVPNVLNDLPMPQTEIGRTILLRSFLFSWERAIVFGARALLGLGFDVECEGDLPSESKRPNPNADRDRGWG